MPFSCMIYNSIPDDNAKQSLYKNFYEYHNNNGVTCTGFKVENACYGI